MLDEKLRPYINAPLNTVAIKLLKFGLKANTLTFIGFCIGLCAFFSLYIQNYTFALIFILISRLFDGLDGAVARHQEQGPTDKGAFYDIVSDFIFYSGVVFFFALGNPEHALVAAFLIFSFMGTASSFLAYGIIAAKRGVMHSKQGEKSFYYAAGLCEGTETIIFLISFCLFPGLFAPLAILFAILCWITTAGRVAMARRHFS